MSVIDVHTHVPTDAFADRYGGSARSFLTACNGNGVDGAWVFPTRGLSEQDTAHNQTVIDYCSWAPDRLIPFCTVFPQLTSAEDTIREAARAGARGIKLHPWLQGFSVTETATGRIGKVAAQLGLPIVFHDGTPPSSSPTQIGAFADTHPDVVVVLGHGGLHDLWMEATRVAIEYPNVFLVPSGVPSGVMRTVIDDVGAEKILFGSDLGYDERDVQWYQLEKIRQLGLSDKALEAVLGGNAQRIIS